MKNNIRKIFKTGFLDDVRKPESISKETCLFLNQLNIKENSQFYCFYKDFYVGLLKHRDEVDELIDVFNDELNFKSSFAHESWHIPLNYILFTTGEGDGGYLYNKDNGTVWDFTLGEQDLLGTDKMPHWNSFYEFLEWYLTVDE